MYGQISGSMDPYQQAKAALMGLGYRDELSELSGLLSEANALKADVSKKYQDSTVFGDIVRKRIQDQLGVISPKVNEIIKRIGVLAEGSTTPTSSDVAGIREDLAVLRDALNSIKFPTAPAAPSVSAAPSAADRVAKRFVLPSTDTSGKPTEPAKDAPLTPEKKAELEKWRKENQAKRDVVKEARSKKMLETKLKTIDKSSGSVIDDFLGIDKDKTVSKDKDGGGAFDSFLKFMQTAPGVVKEGVQIKSELDRQKAEKKAAKGGRGGGGGGGYAPQSSFFSNWGWKEWGLVALGVAILGGSIFGVAKWRKRSVAKNPRRKRTSKRRKA